MTYDFIYIVCNKYLQDSDSGPVQLDNINNNLSKILWSIMFSKADCLEVFHFIASGIIFLNANAFQLQRKLPLTLVL